MHACTITIIYTPNLTMNAADNYKVVHTIYATTVGCRRVLQALIVS